MEPSEEIGWMSGLLNVKNWFVHGEYGAADTDGLDVVNVDADDELGVGASAVDMKFVVGEGISSKDVAVTV